MRQKIVLRERAVPIGEPLVCKKDALKRKK